VVATTQLLRRCCQRDFVREGLCPFTIDSALTQPGKDNKCETALDRWPSIVMMKLGFVVSTH